MCLATRTRLKHIYLCNETHILFSVWSTRLADHLGKAPRNATYVSKNAQNDLLDCIKEYIQDVIVQEISNQEIGPKFAIMADEVTDVSDW